MLLVPGSSTTTSWPTSPDVYSSASGLLARASRSSARHDRHLEVRVSKDCFIRVADVDYSVPPALVGQGCGEGPRRANLSFTSTAT